MASTPTVIALFVASFSTVASAAMWFAWRGARRANHIREYRFPPGLLASLREHHAHLTGGQLQLVARGLRQFFLVWLRAKGKPVAMPSKVVDDLWHGFILHTRHYHDFCNKAFGRYLHHTPAHVLSKDRLDNAALRRTWAHACAEENIDPRKPTRLPLLFALDAKLGIEGGYRYALDCAKLRDTVGDGGGNGSVHCAGDFGDDGFDGGTDGLGDADSGGGDGDGGGCGGD